jgi:hypothetical protein
MWYDYIIYCQEKSKNILLEYKNSPKVLEIPVLN